MLLRVKYYNDFYFMWRKKGNIYTAIILQTEKTEFKKTHQFLCAAATAAAVIPCSDV